MGDISPFSYAMKFQSRSLTRNYKIISKVGEGSFSEVLKCQDMKTGNYFACKRLRKEYISPSQITEIPEVLVLQKIGDHLNIIKLFEAIYESNPGCFTLVFEFCDMSLYDLMKTKERGLAETVVRDYIYQLLCGVDFIHEKGILHRDIKPENIFLKGTLIKLGDFGSIKEINSSHPYTEYVSTRWYRSPECLLTTGYYGPKMDIWSVGCVFYELITLKPLFPGINEIDQLHHIHMIIGSPSSRTMEKLRKHKSSNYDFMLGYRKSCVQTRNTRDHRSLHEAPMSFSLPSLHKYHQQDSCRLFLMANKLSKSGRDVLKQMLTYDSDLRCSARQALEHHYFNLIRSNIIKREKLNPFIVNGEFSKPYQCFPDIPRRFTKVIYENRCRRAIKVRHQSPLEEFPKVFIQKPLHSDGNKFSHSKNCTDTAKGDFQDRWKLPNICAKEEKSSYRRLNSALMTNLPVIHVAPATIYYIPNFVNDEEEKLLLNKIYNVPKPKWTQLSNRRLQNWGGIPHPKGMLVEQIPQWLSLYLGKVYELGVFNDGIKPNHVLINEYLAGQGIMPHFDGPLFYPTIATLSLGSHTVLNFYQPQDDGKVSVEEKIFSLCIEPRSLLILKNDMYCKYPHGIDELMYDMLSSSEVLNYEVCDMLRKRHQEEQVRNIVDSASLKGSSYEMLNSTESECLKHESKCEETESKDELLGESEKVLHDLLKLERSTRVSLTMRHVPKTSKVKLKLGK